MDDQDFEELCQQQIQDARSVLNEALGRINWTRKEITEHQTHRLRDLVKHAKLHSRYYSNLLEGIDPESLSSTDLSSLPITTKQLVMENWDDISTDPELNLAAVRQHMKDLSEGSKHNAYLYNKYIVCATGGSSGKRGVFVWDWELVSHTMAFAFQWEAYMDRQDQQQKKEGSDMVQHQLMPIKKCTATICASSWIHGSRVIWPLIPQFYPERDVKWMSAATPIQELVQQLNEYQPDRIYVYSSLVEPLASQQLQGKLNISLTFIMCSGEVLEEAARDLVRKAWGIETYSSYGATEVAGISYDALDTYGGMVLCEDKMILEYVDENNNPVVSGDAHHLLVTRLYGNESFPLIRMEVTDSIKILPFKDPFKDQIAPYYRRMGPIQGRTDVCFAYAKNINVHPHVFRSALLKYDEIIEYQVQQKPEGAHILLVASQPLDINNITKTSERALVTAGLEQPIVTAQIVKDLPRHPETSKLRRFVPLLK